MDTRVKPAHVECDWCCATRSTSRRLRLGIPDRAPDPLRRQRHVDMGDAVFGERIDHRADDGGEAAGAAGFPAAFFTQRTGFRGRRMIADFPHPEGFRPWPRLVPYRSRETLC